MKTVFKSILAMLAMGVVSVATADPAMDSILYWMLDDSKVAAGTEYLTIKWEGGDSFGYLVNANYGATDGETKFYPDFTVGQYAQIGSTMLNDQYKFIVELFADGGSDPLASYTGYGNMLAGSVGSDMFAITSDPVNLGSAVPEPTSGMLALLGFGLLALRRKQKKA